MRQGRFVSLNDKINRELTSLGRDDRFQAGFSSGCIVPMDSDVSIHRMVQYQPGPRSHGEHRAKR